MNFILYALRPCLNSEVNASLYEGKTLSCRAQTWELESLVFNFEDPHQLPNFSVSFSEKLGWQTPPMLCEFPPSPDSLIHECPVVPHLLGSSSPAWLVTAFFSRQPLNLSIGRALGAWNDNPGSPGLGESVSTSPWWPLCKVLFTFEFCVKFGRLYVDAEASFHWNA